MMDHTTSNHDIITRTNSEYVSAKLNHNLITKTNSEYSSARLCLTVLIR